MIQYNDKGQPFSKRWKDAWSSASRTEIARAELWVDNAKVDEFDTVDGSYTVDGTSQVTRTSQITVPGIQRLIPGRNPDRLWPIGPEFRLFVGLQYPDYTKEFVAAGVYRLSHPSASESGSGNISTSFDGFDRSVVISRNRWTQPYQIFAGSNIAAVIRNIIMDRAPQYNFLFNFEATTAVAAGAILETGSSSDPWKDCQDLATVAGMALDFDITGNPRLRNIVDPASGGVLYRYSVNEQAPITDLLRTIDEEQGYSQVCVRSSNPDAVPIYSLLSDTEVGSSTNVTTFGAKPYFVDTQFIPDKPEGGINQAQSDSIAQAQLLLVKGVIDNVGMKASGPPTHEANDWLYIEREKLGINGNYIMDGYTRKLAGEGVLDMVTRKRRVA